MIPKMEFTQREEIYPGGYVVRVVAARVESEYGGRLVLDLDIDEGPKAGYYQRLADRAGFWGLSLSLYFEESRRWRLERAIDAVKESNQGFVWNDNAENDEQDLIGKQLGIVTRLREYWGNDGKKKTKLGVYSTVPVSVIRSGAFTVPEPLLVDDIQQASAGVVDTTAGFEVGYDEPPF